MENIKTREELKEYFETGDRPTAKQFSELIDGYVHLNELNFGLEVRPTGETYKDHYDFYIAEDIRRSSAGHKIILSKEAGQPEKIDNYSHVLSREVYYKKMHIKLTGGIDIEEHQPKIIIKRYRQRKKFPSGFVRKAGFYQEKPEDAALWNRKSEYVANNKEMIIDLGAIHYFKPSADYKYFSPSGSLNRPGSFMYSMHKKAFVPITMQLEIVVNDINYISSPVGLKIVLGSAGTTDAINFLID